MERFQILGLEALWSSMSCQGLALTCTVQGWGNKQAKPPNTLLLKLLSNENTGFCGAPGISSSLWGTVLLS